MPVRQYVRRVAIMAAIGLLFVAGALVIRHIANVLLVLFGGILFAVVLGGAARLLADRTALGRNAALAVVVVLGLALLAAFFWLAGARISDQATQLAEQLPRVVQELQRELRSSGVGRLFLRQVEREGGAGAPGMELLGGISGMFRTALGAATNLVVIVVLALYLAAAPGLYVQGFLHLLPQEARPRGREVLEVIGRALQRWMGGRLASMLVVGLLTAAGLFVAGVPLAFVLGLIAAVFSFVPFIGPILAAVPGVLIASAESVRLALIAAAVYGGTQVVESYLITPLIQRRAVYIAPALLIAAQVLMGVLFGILGIFLATPLAVAVVVIVQLLYVEDVLGDEITVLGDHAG